MAIIHVDYTPPTPTHSLATVETATATAATEKTPRVQFRSVPPTLFLPHGNYSSLARPTAEQGQAAEAA